VAWMSEEAPASVQADGAVQRGAMETEGAQPPRTARRTEGRQPSPATDLECGLYSSNAPALHGRRRTRPARPWWSRSSGNAGQQHSSVRFLKRLALRVGAEVGFRVNVTDDIGRNVEPEYLRKGTFNDLRQSGNALVGTEPFAAEPAR
jgi:hypothetical protein